MTFAVWLTSDSDSEEEVFFGPRRSFKERFGKNAKWVEFISYYVYTVYLITVCGNFY